MVNIDIEIPAMNVVLADQLSFISLLDGSFHTLALIDVLTAKVDIAGVSTHCVRRNKAAFDQQMRIMAHDVTVFTRARLGLVGVHHEIVRAITNLLRHEGPFQTCREASAAATAQTGCLDLITDPVTATLQHIARQVPCTTLFSRLQRPVFPAIEVSENAILVLKHSCAPSRLQADYGS